MSKESGSARIFLETSFWALGAFCFYWEGRVAVTALRFTTVDLPIFGPCSQMEAIVFTLCTIWVPLVLLHLTLHSFQRICRVDVSQRPHLPGAIGENVVPRQLRYLRYLLFIVLVLVPTLLHFFLLGRAFDHFRIVPNGAIEDALVEKGRAIKPWDLVWNSKRIPDKSSEPAELWWVNAERSEWREVIHPPQVLMDPTKKGGEQGKPGGAAQLPEAEKPSLTGYQRVRTTAFRMQPRLFVLSCLLLGISFVIAVCDAVSGRSLLSGIGSMFKKISGKFFKAPAKTDTETQP